MENLSIEKIFEGIQRVHQNSASLLEDAELLRKNGRVSRSYLLAYMSCEEAGKISILLGVAIKLIIGVPVDWKKFRKRFRSHDSKASQFLGIARALPLILEAAEDKEKILNDEDVMIKSVIGTIFGPALFEQRNNSMYCDLNEDKFIIPDEEITEKMADAMIGFAQTNIKVFKLIYESSADEFINKINRSFDKEKHQEILENSAKWAEFASKAVSEKFRK